MSQLTPFEFKPEFEEPEHPLEKAKQRAYKRGWKILRDAGSLAVGAVTFAIGIEHANQPLAWLGGAIVIAAGLKSVHDVASLEFYEGPEVGRQQASIGIEDDEQYRLEPISKSPL